MATTTTQHGGMARMMGTARRIENTVATRLGAFFAALGRGLDIYMQSRSRVREIERLNTLSDAELAKMGISRDRIPYHVFHDIFYA